MQTANKVYTTEKLIRFFFVIATIYFYACTKHSNLKPATSGNKNIPVGETNLAIPVTAPYDCSNLVNPVTTDLGNIVMIKDVSYSNGIYIPDVSYGGDSLGSCTGTNLHDTVVNGTASLRYDVYYLNTRRFKYQQLPPAIILFHAGGFSDCSEKEGDGMATYCQEFAKRGFVVFNVEYREGRLKDPTVDINGNLFCTASQSLAMYRAFQDGRGAVRSIIKGNNNETPYRFDKSNIFIGGLSAGGYIALNIAYYSNNQWLIKYFLE